MILVPDLSKLATIPTDMIDPEPHPPLNHPHHIPRPRPRNIQRIIDKHYNDAIMGAMASQITSLTIVYSTVYLGADQ